MSQGNWTERRIINATLAGGGGDRGHLCAGAAAKGVHFNNFLNYVNRKRREKKEFRSRIGDISLNWEEKINPNIWNWVLKVRARFEK